MKLCITIHHPNIDGNTVSICWNCAAFTGHQFILHTSGQEEPTWLSSSNTPDGFLYSFQQNKKFALGILQNWTRGLIKRPVMRAIGHSHEHGRHLSSSRHTVQESIAINISSVLCVCLFGFEFEWVGGCLVPLA